MVSMVSMETMEWSQSDVVNGALHCTQTASDHAGPGPWPDPALPFQFFISLGALCFICRYVVCFIGLVCLVCIGLLTWSQGLLGLFGSTMVLFEKICLFRASTAPKRSGNDLERSRIIWKHSESSWNVQKLPNMSEDHPKIIWKHSTNVRKRFNEW